MNSGTLLAFGCAVSFIALAGAYVFIRERWESRTESVRIRSIERRKQVGRVA